LISRVGPEDVETFVKMYEPTFGPYDLMNSPMFTWYVKLIVDNSSTRPFAMSGYKSEVSNSEWAAKITELSRVKFGRPKDVVVAEIMERSKVTKPPEENIPDPFAELLK
ncbi:MAG: hypothetical protein V1821_01485, partial [bacterium]